MYDYAVLLCAAINLWCCRSGAFCSWVNSWPHWRKLAYLYHQSCSPFSPFISFHVYALFTHIHTHTHTRVHTPTHTNIHRHTHPLICAWMHTSLSPGTNDPSHSNLPFSSTSCVCFGTRSSPEVEWAPTSEPNPICRWQKDRNPILSHQTYISCYMAVYCTYVYSLCINTLTTEKVSSKRHVHVQVQFCSWVAIYTSDSKREEDQTPKPKR